MAANEAPPLLSLSRKRPFEDVDGSDNLSPHIHASTTASLPTPPVSHSNNSSPLKPTSTLVRAVSPTASSLTSVSGDPVDDAAPNNNAAGAVPQKRRKLTPAEKLQKQQEKEAKAKERAEAKAKREEDRRVEEEEKQRKRSEREEKKRQKEFEDQQKKQQRDQEKHQREQVKQKEEEEKAKKERSQMRLNSFFAKPKAPPTEPPASPAKQNERPQDIQPNSPKLTGLAPVENAPPVTASPAKPTLSDYEKRFLPFAVPANSVLAPCNFFRTRVSDIDMAARSVEQMMTPAGTVHDIQNDVSRWKADASLECEHISVMHTVQELVTRLQGAPTIPIDLTNESCQPSGLPPLQQLKRIPLKYIHFEQDVRPPYFGTFTKAMCASQSKHLARNAWSRAMPDVDYEYDSEGEWEEPEEGEDLLSDGEDDGESLEGEDDMEGFLDDENDDTTKKRPVLTSELEPESSGLCWEDDNGQMRRQDESDGCPNFRGFRLGILLQGHATTIDPFSTTYWEKDVKRVPSGNSTVASKGNDSNAMQPPARVPLNPIPNGGNSKIMEEFTGKPSTPSHLQTPVKRGPGRPPKAETAGKTKRMVPTEQIEDFKRAIAGSDLTKIALVEDLKKRFPKLPKDAINNTLSTVAARVGVKEVEKRWVLL